ncbi:MULTISPECIES: ADP-ribosylglycohydrolase family protein [Micrococcaceae]|uniref:ADP-ribosylglycohydrolase family protein n=1 Tax=Micrococcaceae TaxID=1268 RepID=UPI000BB6FEEF|nr:ADP-ribosylglycohydrolase family protein [Glutamicibacter sp. BW78]PCC25608.1 hypothetical protein CIK75_08095 [Glutamicibacter sp. BW78]
MTQTPQNLEPRPEFSDRVLAVLRATAAGAAAARAGQVPGETETLQLFLFDGLLEAVEWANDGVASDEAACLWLAGLRWNRAVTGSFPDGAPEPLPRWIDAAFSATDELAAPSLAPADPQNRRALADPDMASTGRPAHPTADGPGVLPRAAVMALLPRVDEGTTARLASDAAALTHGAPGAHRAASYAARAVRAGLDLGAQAPQRWKEILQETADDDGAACAALRAALQAAIDELATRQAATDETGDASAVVRRLGTTPDPDTAGYAAALVASATGYRQAAELPTSTVDSVISQMHHRWVEAVLGTAPDQAG